MFLDEAAGEERAQAAAILLQAMAHPERLRVLILISQQEWSVNDLAQKVGLSQSALSQHLARLRQLKLVQTRRDSQAIFYRCKSPEVTLILDAVREFYRL